MEVDLPITGMKQCKEAYSKGKLIRSIVKEQICAGYPNGGKDSCQVIKRLKSIVWKPITNSEV